MVKISELKKKLLTKPKSLDDVKKEDFLSSGCTVLNLATTDTPNGCFVKGTFHSLVGDSDTGKSVLALSTLAEAAINKSFADYQLVYDNAERGMIMDVEKYFPPLASRLKVNMSSSPEEFYYNLDDCNEQGPYVYILDSMDALIAEAAEEKFQKQKRAHRNQKEATGSYGVDKAKINANNLNRACSKLEKSGSILIIISQTHDSIGGFTLGPPKKSRSGGRSLKFYNRWEVWLKVREKITKRYKDKDVQIGTLATAVIEKNHITGKKRTVEIPIYNAYGVDDLGACIEFLIKWKYWKGTKATVQAKEFAFNGSKEDLIAKIERKEVRRQKLKRIVTEVWNDIESTVALKRKPKYEAY